MERLWRRCNVQVEHEMTDRPVQGKDMVCTKYGGINEKHTFGKHKFFIQRHILNIYEQVVSWALKMQKLKIPLTKTRLFNEVGRNMGRLCGGRGSNVDLRWKGCIEPYNEWSYLFHFTSIFYFRDSWGGGGLWKIKLGQDTIRFVFYSLLSWGKYNNKEMNKARNLLSYTSKSKGDEWVSGYIFCFFKSKGLFRNIIYFLYIYKKYIYI